MKIINYRRDLGVPCPTHPTTRSQVASGPARSTEGQPMAAHESRGGTLMARSRLRETVGSATGASLTGASTSSPGPTRRPYILVWVVGSQGNWAVRYKSVTHIDQVTVMTDSRIGFLAFMPSEVAELLWALLVVGAMGWVVWRASIMMG
ncbi:hypothetical protein FA13DRAFT_1708407 [Coprinellus micaceus]|uniref:Uncharacterized protein n=1 Tax=Coprinellus micaceus TaxID=71717 RepID=A0A4Y7TG84_COPMI|nr:hypothetical protein FA13DRAFT_1708407 [Coprinellus micaceus]